MTVLALSLLVATPIALFLFLGFGASGLVNRSQYVSAPIALLGLISLFLNPAGAVLLLIKRPIGVYFAATGLALWMILTWTTGLLLFGFPLVGEIIMIAELIAGWKIIKTIPDLAAKRVLVNKWSILSISSLVVGLSVYWVILTYGGIVGPFCAPDKNPSIYCAYNYPHSYTGYQEVAVSGNIVATKYSISPLLTREYYELDPYKAWIGYLTLSVTDANGTVLTGAISSRGEAQEQLINHVMSLKPGTRVTLKGYIAAVPNPHCPPEDYSSRSGCSDLIGWMGIKSVDGIDSSNAVLPWSIPDEKKPKWFLGANLSDGMVFNYNITYSQASISPSDAYEQHKEIVSTNTAFLASIKFDNSSQTRNELHFILTIDDLGNKDVQKSHFDCAYNFSSNDFMCSPFQPPTKYLKPLSKAVFYLGKFANATSPKPIQPLWDVWSKDYDYQPTPYQDFEPNRHRIMVLYDKEVSIPTAGMANATVIGWDNAEWFIVKEFPLPIKGEVLQTSRYEANYSIRFDMLPTR